MIINIIFKHKLKSQESDWLKVKFPIKTLLIQLTTSEFELRKILWTLVHEFMLGILLWIIKRQKKTMPPTTATFELYGLLPSLAVVSSALVPRGPLLPLHDYVSKIFPCPGSSLLAYISKSRHLKLFCKEHGCSIQGHKHHPCFPDI